MAYKKILFRRDTSSNWTSQNPILAGGEIGLETNTNKIKLGDGSTAWNSLSYFYGSIDNASLNDLGDVTITSAQNGDVLRWNGTAWVNDPINLATDTIGNYVESLVAGTGVSLSNNSGEAATPTVAIGQSVATSASVTFGKVTTTGDVVVGGNLTVSGTTTSINTETLTVDDNIIVLNNNATGAPTENAGIEVERGSSTNVSLRWNESTDNWELTNDGTNYLTIMDHGSLSDLNHDDHTQYMTNARHDAYDHSTAMGTVNLIDINDVNVSASPISNTFLRYNNGNWEETAIQLGANTTGDYVASLYAGTGITITNNSGEGSQPSIAIGQDVSSSATPTFTSVNANLTGNVTGNASTATTLQNTRTITLSGDVTGSVSFNGSQDVNISATIAESAVVLGTDTTGNYMSGVSAGTGITITHTPGEGSTASIAVTANTYDAYGAASSAQTAAQSYADSAIAATNLDGLFNVTVPSPSSGDFLKWNGTAWVNDPINLGTDTTGNYVNDITAGTGITVTHTPAEGSSPTIAIGQAVGTSSSVTFARVETTGDLIVGGDLSVHGTLTTINETVLAIEDTFIFLNDGSTITNPDLGWVGNYNDGTYRHAGLFRDATDGKFKFFDSYTPEPEDPINTSHASYSAAPVVAEVFESTIATGTAPLSVSSSTAVTNLNADLLDGQHGSFYAPINNASFTGTFSAPSGTITSAMIADGTIANSDISSSAAIDLTKLADVSTNAQTASYTLVLADKNKIVEMNVGSANNLTVPPNSSVAFPVGSQVNVLQTGSGQTTIVAGSGVTVNGTPGLKVRGQWSYVTLIKRATDTWVVVGDLSA